VAMFEGFSTRTVAHTVVALEAFFAEGVSG
jgi:hypothetical protein